MKLLSILWIFIQTCLSIDQSINSTFFCNNILLLLSTDVLEIAPSSDSSS